MKAKLYLLIEQSVNANHQQGLSTPSKKSSISNLVIGPPPAVHQTVTGAPHDDRHPPSMTVVSSRTSSHSATSPQEQQNLSATMQQQQQIHQRQHMPHRRSSGYHSQSTPSQPGLTAPYSPYPMGPFGTGRIDPGRSLNTIYYALEDCHRNVRSTLVTSVKRIRCFGRKTPTCFRSLKRVLLQQRLLLTQNLTSHLVTLPPSLLRHLPKKSKKRALVRWVALRKSCLATCQPFKALLGSL